MKFAWYVVNQLAFLMVAQSAPFYLDTQHKFRCALRNARLQMKYDAAFGKRGAFLDTVVDWHVPHA